MSQPVAWLLGLLGVAVLSVACLFLNAPGIEADLNARLADLGYATSVDGRDVTLTGTVPTQAAKLEAGAEARAVPGVARVFNNLQVAGGGVAQPAPPALGAFSFAATDPDGPVVVRGTVGSEATREAILDRAREAYPGREVRDEIEVVAGTETDWEPSTAALLGGLDGITNAAVTAEGGEIVLRGTVPSEAARGEAEARARAAVQAPYTFRSELVVAGAEAPPEDDASGGQLEASGSTDADVQAAEAALREVLSIGAVQFESGTATLTAESRQILDRAAEVFTRFPRVGAEVQGHTDSQGGEAANQALSQRRAEAVRTYLIETDGVDPDQLTPRGYGEAEPIADNDTAEGRAQNRRVVFSLRTL